MLHVIKRLSQNYPVAIKATFLGAHAFPLEYKDNHQGYMLIDEIIPEIAKHELAQYIDVFCESGYFTVAETEQIMEVELNLAYIPKFMSINSILLRSSIRGEIQCIICRSS
jgi:imidazolonepropionase